MYDVEQILCDDDLCDDVSVIELWAYGSRMRGDYTKDSDIDIVVFYATDDVKEDHLCNILNAEKIEIEGHIVDFNPIRVENERDIKKYKEQSNDYDSKRQWRS